MGGSKALFCAGRNVLLVREEDESCDDKRLIKMMNKVKLFILTDPYRANAEGSAANA